MEDGSEVEGGQFNPELIFTAGPDADGGGVLDGEVFESDRNFFLRVPIIDNSRKLEIRDLDSELLASIDLYDIGRRLCLLP